MLAATNRNLEEEIANTRFRIDLYYRLSVFPLTLPPLRDRRSDIPLLAMHFLERYAREAGKLMTGLSAGAILQLQQYDWPGNIRELENAIFRSVLINQGPIMDKIALKAAFKPTEEKKDDLTIAGNERSHILRVLEKCGWKVAGKNGAASVLNIKVSTLTSRMKKLGITRPK